MAFEDIPRVAQLKLRPSRDDSLRQEAGIGAAEPMKVSEYFHPRVEEVASLLPRRIGEALLRSRGHEETGKQCPSVHVSSGPTLLW